MTIAWTKVHPRCHRRALLIEIDGHKSDVGSATGLSALRRMAVESNRTVAGGLSPLWKIVEFTCERVAIQTEAAKPHFPGRFAWATCVLTQRAALRGDRTREPPPEIPSR